MKTLTSAIVFFAILFLSGCKKSSEVEPVPLPTPPTPAPPPPGGPGVYAAGVRYPGLNSYASYWKNGAYADLSTLGYARNVIVDGNDVHVLGYTSDAAGTHTAYWKNGVQMLTGSQSYSFYPRDFAKSGSDIYIAGSEGSSAVYLKNGVKTTLSGTSAYATGIGVRGSQLLIYGNSYNSGGSTPTVWVDGFRYAFPALSIEEGLLIVGTDLYVTGVGYTTEGGYFKNTTFVPLPGNSPVKVYDIAIAANGDVYCGGSEKNSLNGDRVACSWKNGVKTSLDPGTVISEVTSAFVSGSDVYFGGYVASGSTGGSQQPCIWKNGTLQIYPPSAGRIDDLYVAP